MFKSKDKVVISLYILSAILLTALLATSVTLAAFTNSRNASTTINFANNIALTSSGISSHTWATSTTTADDAFNFNAHNITVTSGTSSNTYVHVRIFAVAWSNANGTIAPLASFTAGSDATTVFNNNATQGTNITAQEYSIVQTFSSSNNYKYICVTKCFDNTELNNAKSLLDIYTPFSATDFANPTKGTEIQGKYVKGSVLITAMNSTSNSSPSLAEWQSAQTVYTFTADAGVSI